MPAQPLRSYLSTDPALARIAQGVANAQALDRLLQQAIPPELRQHAHAVDLAHQCLVIVADSGATAAKIQQMSRTVIKNLVAQGLSIKSLLVRVAPLDRAPAVMTAHTLSPNASNILAASAHALPAGKLRSALKRLARRA